MHKPEPILENEKHKIFWDFEIQMDNLISARRLDQLTVKKKKKKKKKKRKKERSKTSRIVDFDVPVDHRVKLKESEKRDKYLDLARELKKLWNMKVTVIPIVIGALGTLIKDGYRNRRTWK